MTDELIRELAGKLGVQAEYLWTALLKQAPVYAASTLLILIGIGLLVWWLWVKALRYIEEGSFHSEGVAVLYFVCAGVLGFIFLALVSIQGPYILAGFFNPEYWALSRLIGA
jgi:hypothetical protein